MNNVAEAVLTSPFYKANCVQKFWKSIHDSHLLDQKAPRAEDFFPFDQMHYGGTEAIEQVVKTLDLPDGSTLLDVGSGFGGPARYLAQNFDYALTTIELDEEYTHLSRDINRRVGLDSAIEVLSGDFVTYSFPQRFDAIMSFLVFLHVTDKDQLWQKCWQTLQVQGCFCVEDYFLKKPLSLDDKLLLEKIMGSFQLQNKRDYISTIQKNGFYINEWQDITEEWDHWFQHSLTCLQRSYSKYVGIHGPKPAEDLKHFFKKISALFARGTLGGVRVSGWRPKTSSM